MASTASVVETSCFVGMPEELFLVLEGSHKLALCCMIQRVGVRKGCFARAVKVWQVRADHQLFKYLGQFVASHTGLFWV